VVSLMIEELEKGGEAEANRREVYGHKAVKASNPSKLLKEVRRAIDSPIQIARRLNIC